MLTLVQANNPSVSEIVICIGRSGDILTVVRGQEGTSPQTFNLSDNVELRITAGSLNLFAIGGGGGGTASGTSIAEFTATAGQTVFTLPWSYTQGIDNLAIFVNGSKQILNVNFVETSSTSFTMASGLNVGDLVEAIYNLPLSGGVINSDNVTYNQGSTGAVNQTVQDKLQEYVSVEDFGAVGDGTTDDLAAFNLATTYAASSGAKLVLSSSTYVISGEWIIPSNVTIEGYNPLGANPGSIKQAIIKWKTGVSGTGKAVIRCSTLAVGTTPSTAISSSVIRGIKVDATGCDYGIYCAYFTNESALENIDVVGATLANISIHKSWFARYRDLTAYSGVNAGIVFSYALSGEAGDLAVNACDVQNIRAHSNGTGNTYNKTSNPSGGAGIVIGLTFRSSNIGVVQSENNSGPGVYAIPSYVTNIGSMYLESNCTSDTGDNRALYIDSSGNATPWNINALYLASNQRIYSEITITIQALNRPDNINSFVSGTATLNVLTSNLSSFAATDWTYVASAPVMVAQFNNVNIRYTASFANAYFYISEDVPFPYYVVVPRATATLANNFVLTIAPATTLVTNDTRTIGTAFVQGTPITSRGVSQSFGAYKLNVGGTPPSTDTYVDIYVYYTKVGFGKVHP
jgi:hypothetical protein